MKFFVVACLVALAVGKDLRDSQDGSLPVPRIVQMIQQNGYRAEAHNVQTTDGYMLQLIRIPGGRYRNQENQGNQDNQDQENQENQNNQERSNRHAVLLMHNMLGSAEDWVYGGPSQGLAYQMADEGMDVYLGNSRGSKYGMRHTKLDPSKDASFWDFCWDEIATRDMPAIISKVMETSRQQRVQIVGHMTGATATVVMASEVPQARQSVSRIVALGPISFMKRATQPFMKTVYSNRLNKAWILKNLGMAALTPSNQLMSQIQTQCNDVTQQEDKRCDNLYFLVNGFNSNHFNQTTMDRVMQGVPSGSTVKQILHMTQLMESGRFQRYQTGQAPAQDYDLSQATVPITVVYAPQDSLSQSDDVRMLVEKLPNAQWAKIDAATNNMDLLYANNVNRINRKIIDMLNKEPRLEDAGHEDNTLNNMSM